MVTKDILDISLKNFLDELSAKKTCGSTLLPAKPDLDKNKRFTQLLIFLEETKKFSIKGTADFVWEKITLRLCVRK